MTQNRRETILLRISQLFGGALAKMIISFAMHEPTFRRPMDGMKLLAGESLQIRSSFTG